MASADHQGVDSTLFQARRLVIIWHAAALAWQVLMLGMVVPALTLSRSTADVAAMYLQQDFSPTMHVLTHALSVIVHKLLIP